MTPVSTAGDRAGRAAAQEQAALPTAAPAAPFPAASREQWRRLVSGVLAKSGKTGLEGEAAELALSTQLEDGVSVRPLYLAEDGAPNAGLPGSPPYTRGNSTHGAVLEGWDIRAHHADPDPARTHEAVLTDLENGARSLWLELGGEGLPIDALPAVLDGVYLDLAAVVLDAGESFAEAAQALFALLTDRGVPAGQAAGNLGADPLGVLARTGDAAPVPGLLEAAAGLAAECVRDYPGIRALTVDALAYHDAGASPAQELGCALATALGYLRLLTDAGLPLETAAAQLEFRLAATADQFTTIAKLRAARRLWGRVLDACGTPRAAAFGRTHAVTSSVMMTERDPWVNMLRTTVAALAAGVGGAESLTVLPFDAAVGRPDDLARRIARNTQSILLDESHLGRVVDPAGGSWYVEQLTDSLSRAAWAWFQEIERAGGMRAALGSGLVAERIGATWSERAGRLARRREPILGVSEFPNLAEKPLTRRPGPARPGGGLPRVRRSTAFEALRARSDELLAASGTRPRIALLALGPESVSAARSSFAANLFQAGGIETTLVSVSVSPALDADALAKELGNAGAPIACLCSSDAVYAEHAVSAARALVAAGTRRIWLAGRPGEQAGALGEAGITDYVYVGCDALAALQAAFEENADENGARR
jgi:methylmalonyl-CoA mutase